MGQKTSKVMNIHICGIDKEDSSNNISQMKILNTLFPRTDKNLSTSNYMVKYNEKGSWNAYIYLEKNTNNFKFVKETILKQIEQFIGIDEKGKLKNEDEKALKNHMIILFVTKPNLDELFLEEFNKEETIDDLNENFPLILFLFKDTDRDNLYYKDMFFDFSYIDCINMNKITSEQRDDKLSNENYIALYLQTLLYNRYDSYFTERGCQIINEINPVSKEPIVGIYLPVILCGTPGVGKSTFINDFACHRISKASPSQQGVTTKSAIYDVKIPGNINEEYQMDIDVKQDAYIRFIDTPGFDLEKEVEIVQKEIEKVFNDFKQGKERIPVILYFLNPIGRNFSKEDTKASKLFNILKFLQKNNSKIIFVITHMNEKERWQQKASFKQRLKETGLDNLIEADDSNIIKVQLIGGDSKGIKKIFKKIYDYTNFIYDDENNQTDRIYQSILEELKKRKTFDEKLMFIKSKTNLFNEFQSKEDILVYGRKQSLKIMLSMSTAAAGAGAIPIPFADIGVVMSIITSAIVQIGKAYGYIWKKISKKDLFAIYRGELYKKENEENSMFFNNYFELAKIIGEIFAKGIMMFFALTIDDVIKSLWGLGTTIGMAIGAVADSGIVYKYSYNAKKYFESKCKEDDGTIFFSTRCGEYEIIFRRFKQFENYNLIIP